MVGPPSRRGAPPDRGSRRWVKSSQLLSVVFCCIAGLFARAARADNAPQCIAAFEGGQVMRKSGQLGEARQAFVQCATTGCPRAVAGLCAKWMDEIDAMAPSVLFNVAVNNEEVTEGVTVEMDGKAFMQTVDARGRDVDPGWHNFVIRLDGFAPAERRVFFREGEKLKRVGIAFEREKAAPVSEAAAPASPVTSRPVPVGVYAVAGLGVAGLVVGTVFELLAVSGRHNLEGTCSPVCADDKIQTVQTQYSIRDITLGVGAAGLLGAGAWYLARPSTHVGSLTLTPGVGSLHVHGFF